MKIPRIPPDIPRVAEFAIVTLLITVFVALQTAYPELPGMTPEGLLQDQFLAGDILDMLRENSFTRLFLEGRLPSQRLNYHSTLMAYLYLPFYYLFGPNWLVAKLWPVMWSVFTLLFTYFFVKDFFGKRGGFLTLFLLVIHPNYFMAVREGGYLLTHMHFFSMGTLLCLGRWWLTHKKLYLHGAMLLLGLGLATQLWFVWFVVALLIGAAVFKKDIRDEFGLYGARSWAREVVPAGIFLILGASLVVYREFTQPFASITTLLSQLSPTNPYGPLNYFGNLPKVICLFNSVLTGNWFFHTLFDFKASHLADPSVVFEFAGNHLYPWVFYSSALFIALCRRRCQPSGKAALLIVLLQLAMLGQSPIAPRMPDVHLIFFYPFPQIIISIALVRAMDVLSRRKFFQVLLIGSIAFFATKEVRCLERCFYQLKTTGGATIFSDTIYDLADWLAEGHARARPIFLHDECDSSESVRHLHFILPNSGLKYVFVAGENHSDIIRDFERKLRSKAASGALIIRNFHGGRPDVFLMLKGWAERNNSPLRMLKQFIDEDGRAVFEVYEYSPCKYSK